MYPPSLPVANAGVSGASAATEATVATAVAIAVDFFTRCLIRLSHFFVNSDPPLSLRRRIHPRFGLVPPLRMSITATGIVVNGSRRRHGQQFAESKKKSIGWGSLHGNQRRVLLLTSSGPFGCSLWAVTWALSGVV